MARYRDRLIRLVEHRGAVKERSGPFNGSHERVVAYDAERFCHQSSSVLDASALMPCEDDWL